MPYLLNLPFPPVYTHCTSGKAGLKHVGLQFASPRSCLMLSLTRRIYFPEREREEFPIMPSLRSIQVSFLKHCYTTLLIHTWVACQPEEQGSIILLAEFDWVVFFLDCQIVKLKTSPKFPAIRKIHTDITELLTDYKIVQKLSTKTVHTHVIEQYTFSSCSFRSCFLVQ